MSGGRGGSTTGGRPKGKPTASPLGATMGVNPSALSSGIEATTKRPNSGLGGMGSREPGKKSERVASVQPIAGPAALPASGASGGSDTMEAALGIARKPRNRRATARTGLGNSSAASVTLG